MARSTCAELNGQRAGSGTLCRLRPILEPFLTLILVLDPYKRQGIGTQLMPNWEQAMRTKGYQFPDRPLHRLTKTLSSSIAGSGNRYTGALLLPGTGSDESWRR
jgi:GNAT superfamily N-acetyltransferase